MDHFCYLCFVFVILSCVHCSLVITCWKRANLLALLYVMFYYIFATFPCGVLGQVWFLIVSIPDLCLLTYFNDHINDISCIFSWIKNTHFRNRGSNMSAHVLSNLLNELRKRDKMRGLWSNEFNNFINQEHEC